MDLSVGQIEALAPDASAAAAGKKLGSKGHWKSAGRSAVAVWGECQGSALYQVRVDLGDFAYRCSCPSRKLPCKHVLGLLFLTANSPGDVPTSEPPPWVSEWLSQRAARAAKQQAKKTEPSKPADAAAQARRAEQRQERVAAGLERLDLWMSDLVRNGLAGLEQQPAAFWETEARHLVDAQAPGLAARVRRLAEIPGSTPDWPAVLLGELGRMALLTAAYRRLEQLEPALQSDVRQMIGWTVRQEELTLQGETVADQWLILGQTVADEERVRVQRNWLLGRVTGRTATVLQFSASGQPFPETIVPGTMVEGELVFWPGAAADRAKFAARHGETVRIAGRIPGHDSIDAFLEHVAATLARQPWRDRFLAVLRQVVPVPGKPPWYVRDVHGRALPLVRREHWQLLALSGGQPIDLAAQWNGRELSPLGVAGDHEYHCLAEGLSS
jgi:hypothetical protein